MTRKFTFTFRELPLRIRDLEFLLGYQDGNVPEPVADAIHDVLADIGEYCKIRGGYTLIDQVGFNSAEKSLTMKNKDFHVKNIVFQQLRKSSGMIIFICTAGAGISDWSTQMIRQGDMLKGYIIDTAGSLIVESAMDLLQEEIRKDIAAEGLKMTNRYSPGYCGWDVIEQHKLFSFFPESFCDIRLTENALMYPVKSVSGFIGVGENAEQNPYTCSLCEQDHCVYRNLKMQ